jgi:ribosomal subunit interface protein
MDCTLTGRHVEVTEELRELIERRLAPLDRLLGDAAISADMVLTAAERPHYQTEFVVHARGNHRLHGVGNGESWPVAVGAAVDKVMHQAQTLKGKWQARRRRAEAVPGAGPDRDGSVDTDEPTPGE